MVRVFQVTRGVAAKPVEISLEDAPADGTTIAFSESGDRLAVATLADIRVRQLPEGRLLKQLPKNSIVSEVLHFHPEGRHIVEAGDDYKIRIYEIESGKLISTLDFERGVIGGTDLDFNPTGEYLAATYFLTPHPQTWLWAAEDVYDDICERLRPTDQEDWWQEYLMETSRDMETCEVRGR